MHKEVSQSASSNEPKLTYIYKDIRPTDGHKVSGLLKTTSAHSQCLVSMVTLISCIASSRLILSLRGFYYSQMDIGPTTLDAVAKVEFGHTTQGSVPYTPSSGTATSLRTSILAAYGERNGRTCERSENPDADLENLR